MRVGIGFMFARDEQKTSICGFRRPISRMNVPDAASSWKRKTSGLRSSEEAYRAVGYDFLKY
jgi:hypothetical protein